MNVTKQDIVSSIAKATGITATDTKLVVEGFIESLCSALEEGKTIELRGFGTFGPVERAPRTVYDYKKNDGSMMTHPAHTTAAFKPSKILKGRLNPWWPG